MKILVVSSFMPPHLGGLELVASGLVDGLQERGHDLRWLASANPLPAGKEGHLVRVRAFNGMEDWLSVPLPLWGPGGLIELNKLCRWADVVHVHDSLYPTSWLATACANAWGKPVILTQHISEVPYPSALKVGLQKAVYRTAGRMLMESCARIIVHSRHVQSYFLNLGISTPIELLPLGFDDRFRLPTAAERSAYRKRWGIAEEAKVVLFAGRLVEKKGITSVAAVQSAMAREGVQLVVAGDGPERSRLEGLDGVHHLKQLPYEEMHKIYALADALILPSYGEGLPLTVLEGMLTGLPVVVSKDPSYVSNLSEAPGVFLCASVDELVPAIRQALANPDARAEVSTWARATWGRERYISGYEGAMRTLCARRGRHVEG